MGKKPPPPQGAARPGVPKPRAQAIDPAAWAQAQQLLQQGELQQAQQVVDGMLAAVPDEPNALNLKALIAARLNQFDVAESAWRSLLRRNPGHANVRSNLGALLLLTGRLEDAVTELRQTVADAPDMVSGHTNLGVALERLGREDEALASYERSLALDRNPLTLFNIGNLLQGQQDYAEAHQRYRQALAIDPTMGDAFGNLVMTQHYLPYFDPAINRDTARHYGATLARGAARPAFRTPDSLRVGMVSADLRQHAVAHFLGAVLAHLDPARMQLHAYSNSAVQDETTARLRRFFAGWRQIDTLNDRQAAECIRDDGIDVLIDLSGLTAGHRQGLFAERPAPLQLSWLGYFSTTGNPAIDCVLADPTTVPAGEESLFVEKVWRLPEIRYCFTPPEPAPPPWRRCRRAARATSPSGRSRPCPRSTSACCTAGHASWPVRQARGCASRTARWIRPACARALKASCRRTACRASAFIWSAARRARPTWRRTQAWTSCWTPSPTPAARPPPKRCGWACPRSPWHCPACWAARVRRS